VTNQPVYRSETDPNSVLVMHAFGSSEGAHCFLERPDLRQAMQDAGVDAGSLRRSSTPRPEKTSFGRVIGHRGLECDS